MAKKGKKKKGDEAAAPEQPELSVSASPKATRAVRRMKAWAALIGFFLVALLSWRAGVEPFEMGLRALAAGLVLYLVAWFAGIALWRQIVMHEAKTQIEKLKAEREALLEKQAAEAAERAKAKKDEAVA